MIYLKDNLLPQEIDVPVVFADRVSGLGQCRILLFSNVNRVKSFDYYLPYNDFNNDYNADFAIVAQPLVSASRNYYTIGFSFENVPQVGEYSYVLMSENKGILSKGLCIVGEYHSERTEYEITKEYKQYEG